MFCLEKKTQVMEKTGKSRFGPVRPSKKLVWPGSARFGPVQPSIHFCRKPAVQHDSARFGPVRRPKQRETPLTLKDANTLSKTQRRRCVSYQRRTRGSPLLHKRTGQQPHVPAPFSHISLCMFNNQFHLTVFQHVPGLTPSGHRGRTPTLLRVTSTHAAVFL